MISDDVRVPLIAAAAAAAGDSTSPDWAAKVAENAVSLFTMADPSSTVSKRLDRVASAKKFVATITSVEVEESSTRGVVGLKTKPSDFNPDGVEHARTERTDSPDGAAIVSKLQGMVGHRVLAYVAIDDIGKGPSARKMRVLVHVEDLGPDRFGDAPAPTVQPQANYQPAPTQQWGQGGYADDQPPF